MMLQYENYLKQKTSVYSLKVGVLYVRLKTRKGRVVLNVVFIYLFFLIQSLLRLLC